MRFQVLTAVTTKTVNVIDQTRLDWLFVARVMGSLMNASLNAVLTVATNYKETVITSDVRIGLYLGSFRYCSIESL